MKRVFFFLVLLLLSACVQVAEKPYKFGAALPLTGTNAYYGEYMKAGIELAVADINSAGGINGRTVVAVIEDTASDKTKAATAGQKLVEIDDIDAFFTVLSSPAGVLAPIAEEHMIPFIYNSQSNSFAVNKTFVFKDYSDISKVCGLLMKTALKTHEKVSLIAVNTETGQLCRKGAESSGKLEAFETFEVGETDLRTQVMKLKDSSAIIIMAVTDSCPPVYKQIRELGIKAQLYIPVYSIGCGTTENLAVNRDLLSNAFGADIVIDETALADFEKRLKTPQVAGSAIIYDDVMSMAQAYKGCEDTACVANNLRSLNYKGITGTIGYDGQIVKRDIALAKFDNSKWVRT
jgi:ABC-type branched-subunit amino acid transport system substrate-binding protein